MEKLELVSGWLNAHADELALDLNIEIDNDSPLWAELEKEILKTFMKTKLERVDDYLDEICLGEAMDKATDGLFQSIREQIDNTNCPEYLKDKLFRQCNNMVIIDYKR